MNLNKTNEILKEFSSKLILEIRSIVCDMEHSYYKEDVVGELYKLVVATLNVRNVLNKDVEDYKNLSMEELNEISNKALEGTTDFIEMFNEIKKNS